MNELESHEHNFRTAELVAKTKAAHRAWVKARDQKHRDAIKAAKTYNELRNELQQHTRWNNVQLFAVIIEGKDY